MGRSLGAGVQLMCSGVGEATSPLRHRGDAEAEEHRVSRTWRSNCTWARYEARHSFLQAEYVKQHACSDCHKLGEQAFLMPDEPVRLSLQRDYSDDRLLSGAVPQLQDWVRVWRWSREGDSWASAERHSLTENWIDQLRNPYVVKRRAIRSMAMVMRGSRWQAWQACAVHQS